MYKIVLMVLFTGYFALTTHADANAEKPLTTTPQAIPGETPLMSAVRSGDAAQVSELLKSGVDVNARNAGGVTALMLAAAQGRTKITEILLSAGARPDINNYDGATAAAMAAQNDHDILALMLKSRSKALEKNQPTGGYEFADDAHVDVKHPAWFKQSLFDLRDDLEEARANGKQGIILFMSTRRCSYCKVFLDRVFADPDVKQRVQSNYDVIGMEIFSDLEMSDIDGQSYRVKDFVNKVKASYTPTLIFYSADAQRALKIVGYYPREKFTRVLDYFEGRNDLSEPLRDYLRRTESATSTAKMIIDEGLFSRPPYILDRRVGKGERPLLVVFERDDCDACTRLHQRVFKDTTIRKLISRFEAVQLNLTDNTHRVLTPAGERLTAQQWYEQLDLNYSPAIVFFDEVGREVMRIDSETLRYRMEGSLQLVLAKDYGKLAQLQRWRRDKAIEASKSGK